MQTRPPAKSTRKSACISPAVERFIQARAAHLDLSRIVDELTEAFPEGPRLSRSALHRYLQKKRWTGRVPGLRNPKVRAFLKKPELALLSYKHISREIAKVFPDNQVVSHDDLHAYFRRNGRAKPIRGMIDLELLTYLRGLKIVPAYSALMRDLHQTFPGKSLPGKSALYRYLKDHAAGGVYKTVKRQRDPWAAFDEDMQAVIRRNMRQLTLDSLRDELAFYFPDRQTPSRSTIGRFVKFLKDTEI